MTTKSKPEYLFLTPEQAIDLVHDNLLSNNIPEPEIFLKIITLIKQWTTRTKHSSILTNRTKKLRLSKFTDALNWYQMKLNSGEV